MNCIIKMAPKRLKDRKENLKMLLEFYEILRIMTKIPDNKWKRVSIHEDLAEIENNLKNFVTSFEGSSFHVYQKLPSGRVSANSILIVYFK